MTNHNLIIITTVITLIFFSSSCSVNAVTCNKPDRAALLAFKDSFPDKSFYHSYPDWVANSTNDCCSWDYVQCDSTGRVTSFVLSGNSFDPPDMDLNGTIPAVLGDLTALKTIRFDYMPGLVGPIPPQIVKLKKLESLVISNCQITGSVPSFLSQLPSLQQLDLGHNKLVGTIPPSLADLINLSSLSLHDNQLTGTIPPQSFADVDFDDCYLDNNKFTGDLSLLFGRNKTVTSISMYSNNFRFDLSDVEYPLALTYLDISRNEIYGSISNQITEVPNLSFVVFSYNNLCGKIPSGGHFRTFDAVYFEHNKCLCGAPLKPCK